MSDRLIVITHPEFFEGEAELLNTMFQAGLSRLHLRKPCASAEQVLAFLSQIEAGHRRKIYVHHHEKIVEDLELGGVHYSFSTISGSQKARNYGVSCSVHSWEELIQCASFADYFLISPFLNSISKAGYQANEELKHLPVLVQGKKVYALGGIDPSNFYQALEAGYFGVAVLGYLWTDPEQAPQRYLLMKSSVEDYLTKQAL